MHYLRHYIDNRATVSMKWRELAETMAVHIYGKKPTHLLENRRPLESQNSYALNYRLANWQPITKQPFLIALGEIAQIASHLYAPEMNLSGVVREWIDENPIYIEGSSRGQKLRDFVTSQLVIQSEGDPNSAMVVIPVHPTDKLVTDYRADIPDFDNVRNEFVDLDVRIIKSRDIHYLDDQRILFKGGDWLYSIKEKKNLFAPYYYALSKESTTLFIPRKGSDGVIYDEVFYYANNLETIPFTVIGNNLQIDDLDGEIVTFASGTFPGAVAIMNEVVGTKSDSSIVDTRYTYPQTIAQYLQCGAGCIQCVDKDNKYHGLNVHYDGDGSCNLCSTCNGSGSVAPDTTPLGSWILTADKMYDSDNKFIPPIQYITPPLDSARYLSEQWRELLAEGKRALFILDQNMTNQSGESKSYDVRQKVSTLSGAVRNLFRVYQHTLNVISGFLLEPETVYVELPIDLNVKNSQDLTQELAQSANTSSTYTSELTKELLLKRFGNDADVRRSVNWLEINDKLFGMSIDEILKVRAVYGSQLTARDQFIHDKGFAILMKLKETVENFSTLTDDELKALFDAEIDNLFSLAPVGIA